MSFVWSSFRCFHCRKNALSLYIMYIKLETWFNLLILELFNPGCLVISWFRELLRSRTGSSPRASYRNITLETLGTSLADPDTLSANLPQMDQRERPHPYIEMGSIRMTSSRTVLGVTQQDRVGLHMSWKNTRNRILFRLRTRIWEEVRRVSNIFLAFIFLLSRKYLDWKK